MGRLPSSTLLFGARPARASLQTESVERCNFFFWRGREGRHLKTFGEDEMRAEKKKVGPAGPTYCARGQGFTSTPSTVTAKSRKDDTVANWGRGRRRRVHHEAPRSADRGICGRAGETRREFRTHSTIRDRVRVCVAFMLTES